MTAIAEIMESTTKGLAIITGAKDTAVTNLQQKYDDISTDWDKTKAELDFETKLAIIYLHNALHEISYISIYMCIVKTDLDETRNTVDALHENLDDVISKATAAATTVIISAVDKSTKKAIHNITFHSDAHLQNMNDVFSENMGLMHDQHSSYNTNQLCIDAKMVAIANIEEIINTKAETAIAKINKATTALSTLQTTIATDTTISATHNHIMSDMTNDKARVKVEMT